MEKFDGIILAYLSLMHILPRMQGNTPKAPIRQVNTAYRWTRLYHE